MAHRVIVGAKVERASPWHDVPSQIPCAMVMFLKRGKEMCSADPAPLMSRTALKMTKLFRQGIE